MEHIRISLADWQYNAGIIGLYNILKKAGKDIAEYTKTYAKKHKEENINENYEFYFPISYLEDFTDNYYSYFIDTYINQISYGKILDKKDFIKDLLNTEKENITREKIDELNNYIKDVFKYYMKSSSYKAAFELIENNQSEKDYNTKEDLRKVLNIIENIQTIKINKKDILSDKKEDIEETCKLILQVLDTISTDIWKKYIGGKNIIYNILKNNWDGVSVLNKQVKEKDIYIEFENYFVKPAILYIQEDKKKYKFNCYCCDSPIKNLDNNISFLTNTGFDTNRKSSHTWDFQNDIGICDVCKLVYACMPAGFFYGFDKAIFINANTNINTLKDTNNKLKNNIKRSILQSEKNTTYKSVVEAIVQSRIENIDYELLDVQVVFLEKAEDKIKYSFNILHKNILDVIIRSEKEFEKIKNASLVENKKYIYLYEETIKNVLSNRNSFLWINKLLHYYISNKTQCYYTPRVVEQILRINFNYMKGVGSMENIESKIITDMRNYGYYVRRDYKSKGSQQKLDGISYRLLNALKTSNVNAFMDTLIRAYMYIGKEIPKNFINSLKDEDEFKNNGYAFVVGLNGADFGDEIKEEK